MEKVTLYKIAVGGLLLLNIVLVAFLWLGRPNAQRGPFHVVERLALGQQQSEQFLQSAELHQTQMRRINEEQRQALQDYFGTLKTSVNTGASPVPQLVLRLEEEKIRSTYEHLLGVKSILRPDQREEYPAFIDFVIRQVLKKTGKEPRPQGKREKS